MINKYLLLFILPLLLWSCRENGLDPNPVQEPTEWITAKVAIVLPLSGANSDKERYDRICIYLRTTSPKHSSTPPKV